MKILQYAFFIILATSMYFGLHYYIYSSIARSLILSSSSKMYLKVFMSLGGLSFFIHEFARRKTTFQLLSYIGTIWIGMISIAFFVLIVKDLFLLLFPAYKKALTLLALATIVVVSFFSIYNGFSMPTLNEVTVAVKKLPENLSGFTIVHMSDIHLDRSTSKKRLQSIVDQVNELNSDLIVITGDLLDDKLDGENELAHILKELKSTHGSYAVSGNHEFYAGIDYFYSFCKAANLFVLDNQNKTIADAIEIVGLADDTAKRFSLDLGDIVSATKSVDFNKTVVLLSHKPIDFEKYVAKGIDLQLSGHTHAGQIPPLSFLVPFVYRYSYGLYAYESSHIYTSSGTGLWGPPMRFLTNSEIVKITLIPAK